MQPLTYCSAEQFLPIRFEVEDHTPPGPRQSGPSDEQHQEDQVGEGSSHPDYLKQNRGIHNQLYRPVRGSACQQASQAAALCIKPVGGGAGYSLRPQQTLLPHLSVWSYSVITVRNNL